jgi:hypothetical protein
LRLVDQELPRDAANERDVSRSAGDAERRAASGSGNARP